MKLSVIIPAYNEEESIVILLDEIMGVCERESISCEIIVIDDGSTDATYEKVNHYHQKDPRVNAVRLRVNSGKAAALAIGFKCASGENVITMDADLQDNPSEIPGLLAELDSGWDLVSGWKKKRYDPWHKKIPSKFFNFVTSRASGLKLHDFNCGLKAYKCEVVKSLNLYGEMHRYIPVLAHWDGFRVTEKEVVHRPRKYGSSKYGLARLFHGLFDLITLVFLHSYLRRPLHLFGFVGLLFNLAGFGILAYFGLEWMIEGHLHVRPLMLGGVALVIVGVQFVSLGLLGELLTSRLSDDRGGGGYPIAKMTNPERVDFKK